MKNYRLVINNNVVAACLNLQAISPNFAQSNLFANITIDNQADNSLQSFEPIFCNDGINNTFDYIIDWLSNNSELDKMPAQIYYEGTLVVSGFIDFVGCEINYETNEIKAKFLDLQNLVFEKIQNIKLREIPALLNYKKTEILCVRQSYPTTTDYVQVVLLILQITLMTYNLAADLTNALATITSPATVAAIATLAATILIVAIYAALKDIKETLFADNLRYFVIPAQFIWENVLIYLGLEGKTDYFDREFKNLVFLASTDIEPASNKKAKNNPCPDKTISEFFTDLAKLRRYEYKIDARTNTIYFYPADYYRQDNSIFLSDFVVKNTFQTTIRTTNASQLPSNITVSYITDNFNGNTKNNDDKYKVSQNFTLNSVNNSYFNNKIDITLPFSIMMRKGTLTVAEKLFNTAFDIIDTAFKALGGNKDVQRIGERKGSMLLANTYVGNDYIGIVEKLNDITLLSDKSIEILSAESIYLNYWQRLSPSNNQWEIITTTEGQPLSPLQVFELQVKNLVKDSENNVCVLTKLEQLDNGLVTVQYWRKKDYLKPTQIKAGAIIKGD